MNEGNVAWDYRTMSAEDRRTFHRWLKLNATAGLIIASGLVAMAWVGSNSAGSHGAMLANNFADPVVSEKAVAGHAHLTAPRLNLKTAKARALGAD
jgi:hypothetical protein